MTKDCLGIIILDSYGQVTHMNDIVLSHKVLWRLLVDVVAMEADIRGKPFRRRDLIETDVKSVQLGGSRMGASKFKEPDPAATVAYGQSLPHRVS